MQTLFQPKRYSTNMPPTPVTDEMRSKLVELAQSENVSLAQVQRTAFAVLLRLMNAMSLAKVESDQQTTEEMTETVKKEIYMELLNAQHEDFR